MAPKLKNEKGVVLVFVFVSLMVLAILSVASLSRSTSESNIARRQGSSIQAFWLAEAAAQRGLYAVQQNNWSQWNVTNTSTLSENLGGGVLSVTVSGFGTNDVLVMCNGTVSGETRNVTISLSKLSHPRFGYAAFGVNNINMTGNAYTDSYNSSLGAYGGSNVYLRGKVATDGTATGVVNLSGNAIIKGDVATGVGGTVTNTSNSYVRGNITHAMNWTMPNTEIPADLNALNATTSITVAGNGNQTLGSGNYKKPTVSVSGNAKLYVSGTVRIYLTSTSADALSTSGNGQITINNASQLIVYSNGIANISGNGIVNNALKPQNCRIYSTYNGTSDGVLLAGNGALKATVYAPQTTINYTGNAAMYGSVVGKQIMVYGNGIIHYDEALADLDTIGGNYSVDNTWQEETHPYVLEPE